jgi:hypothetical protein
LSRGGWGVSNMLIYYPSSALDPPQLNSLPLYVFSASICVGWIGDKWINAVYTLEWKTVYVQRYVRCTDLFGAFHG